MDLREEFDRLVKLFEEGAEGKVINLDDIFVQSLEFFEHLKGQIQMGSPEEKQDAVKMMTELYQHMANQTKKICEKSGLSEEQLVKYADNPRNFSPEQWRSIQESKEKIAQAGSDLVKSIRKTGEDPKGKQSSEKPRPSGLKRKSQSKWLRS